jgi:SpoVK/Ycf46/Vps4 family AAA+-type ATPase
VVYIHYGRFILDSSENSPKIKAEDAKQALHLVKPSAMREVLVEVPDVSQFVNN